MTDRRLTWFAGLAAAFALHAGLRYFSGALAGGIFSAALLALVFFTAAGCGRLILRSFRVRGAAEPEKTLIGATLGLGLLSQGVFALGAAGLLRPWSVSVLLGVFWIVGFTEMRDLWSSLSANRELLRDRPAMSGAVLLLLGISFWLCLVPPHQYDSLVYHLPLAETYAREGRLAVRPDLLYTHFPQNGEMLYTLALLLGSDVLAQMLTWLGLFLSVWWIIEMGKRQFPVTVVLLACLLTLTHTAVLLLSSTTYVECLVMLWITASVLSLLRWRIEADVDDQPRGWLALAGVFAGLGVGTKYYAGITPAVLAVYLAWRWGAARLRRPRDLPQRLHARSRLKDVFVFSATAFAAGIPWLVKNAVLVGNPVFPFLYRFFPMRGVDWAKPAAARYFEILTEYGHVKGRFLEELFQFPYLAATGSVRFGGGADVLGGLGWALLFMAAPLIPLAARKKRYAAWIAAYCLAHFVCWYSTGVVLRFLTVIVPLAALAAAAGLHDAWERLEPLGRVLLAAAVGALIWTNLALFLYVNTVVDSASVLLGAKTRGKFLASKFDYYPCAAWAREALPQNDRILVVGEQRGYYVAQPHEVTTPMSPNRFVKMANASGDTDTLVSRLKDGAGIKYLLVVPREGRRLGEQYGVFHFSEKGRANWEDFEDSRLDTVFRSSGRCAVFKIK